MTRAGPALDRITIVWLFRYSGLILGLLPGDTEFYSRICSPRASQLECRDSGFALRLLFRSNYLKLHIAIAGLLLTVSLTSFIPKEKATGTGQVGDGQVGAVPTDKSRTFDIYNARGRMRRTVTARLAGSGRHTEIWVDTSRPIPRPSVSRLLTRFDKQIYPRDTRYFATPAARRRLGPNRERAGAERKRTGRVIILVTDTGQSDGYFDPADLSGRNRANLIYVNAKVVRDEPAEAENTLAHEFEHMLFYLGSGKTRGSRAAAGQTDGSKGAAGKTAGSKTAGAQDTEWLDEGLAVYAEYINGGHPDLYVRGFRDSPDVRFAGRFSSANNSYGAAFLFVASAAREVERSAGSVPRFTRALVARSSEDRAALNHVLRRYIRNPRADSVDELYRRDRLTRFGRALITSANAPAKIPMA